MDPKVLGDAVVPAVDAVNNHSLMDPNVWIALGAMILTGLGYVITATMYVARVEMRSRELVDNSKELMLAVIERESSKEQKARHDLASHIQIQISELDKDYRLLADRMILMVHKEDLNAAERRILVQLEKLEKRIEDGPARRNG